MDIRATGDPRFLINMSVWTTPEILGPFTIFRNRKMV
jgi:hypothetical protein